MEEEMERWMDGESELGAKMGGMDDAGTAVSSGYRARQPAKWGAITTLGSWARTGYNTKYVMCRGRRGQAIELC